MEEHIVIVDDNKALCNTIADQVDRRYGEKYLIDRFFDAKSAIDYIQERVGWLSIIK